MIIGILLRLLGLIRLVIVLLREWLIIDSMVCWFGMGRFVVVNFILILWIIVFWLFISVLLILKMMRYIGCF